VLITSGSQQGLDMTGKVFLDEGDLVLCESPTYLGALNAFQVFKPRFREVPTDNEGMIISKLEDLIRAERPKFIYVIPDFQNPTGRTWSLDRRYAFMDLVERFRVPVIEDAPYSEVRFEGIDRFSIKSLDRADLVVYLGTFSKTFCPGMRLAWLAAPPEIFRKYALVKQGTDLHTSTFTQLLLHTFMERPSFDANIERIRKLYRERRDVMLNAIKQYFPDDIHINRPQGGLFLWVELPKCADARALLRRCLARKVAFVPGEAFFPKGGHKNTFRMNFSSLPGDKIVEGIKRLAGVLGAYLSELDPFRTKEGSGREELKLRNRRLDLRTAGD
jgi:DNA-binding transcriptional MocR family regulator